MANTIELQVKGKDDASGAINGVAKSLGGLKNALGAVGVGLGLKEVAQTVIELGQLGAQARIAQEKLTALAGGSQQAAGYIEAIGVASNGTVDRLTAMNAANKLVGMGLVENAQEAGKMVEMAVRMGDASQDASGRISDFAAMLANQSIPRLDNYGISSGRVRARIEELMRANAGLSREAAFTQAVLEQGTATLERLGDAGQGSVQNMDRLKASLADLKLTVGTMVEPALSSLSGTVASAGTTMSQLIQVYGYAIQQYGYFRGGLMANQELLGIHTQLTEDAALNERALAAGLAAAAQGYSDVGASIPAATTATEAFAEAVEASKESVANLATLVQGPVTEENTRYAEQMETLRGRAEELGGKIDELAGKRHLSEQQKADLAQWREELGQVQQEMSKTEQEHTRAMNKIILDMTLARLSVDGLTESEMAFATTVAEQMGLVDKSTADAMHAVNASIETFNRTGSAETAAGLLRGISQAAAEIPRTVAINVEWNIQQPPGELPGPGERPRAYAEGGLVATAGMALVGERGPELVWLPAGAEVTPAAETRQVLAGNGGREATIQVFGGLNLYGVQDARSLLQELQRLGR